jgi:hypothetical protein
MELGFEVLESELGMTPVESEEQPMMQVDSVEQPTLEWVRASELLRLESKSKVRAGIDT